MKKRTKKAKKDQKVTNPLFEFIEVKIESRFIKNFETIVTYLMLELTTFFCINLMISIVVIILHVKLKFFLVFGPSWTQ